MKSTAIIVSFVALLGTALQRADASYALRTLSHVQPSIVLQTSDLRSAYLQRVGVVGYDESNSTPQGVRRQLQRHFDVVLSSLSSATSGSIETAVVRLEAADDHSWTANERAAWRQKLLAARLEQLQRLTAYRDRGIFPLNEGQSTQTVPIFVDRHGTACAVGHLMRCSGWSGDVDSIAQSDNLVYVPDAMQSAVAAWVLTSGLTLEEAALIQPAYSWFSAQFDASAYEPGESTLERNGLHFSNFRLQAENFPLDDGARPTLAGLGLLTGAGSYSPPGQPFLQHNPIGTNWFAVGVQNSQLALHELNASAAVGRGQMVVVNFDVAAIAADQRINGITESSYEYWGGFFGMSGVLPPGTPFYLKTTALDGATSVASLNIDQSTPGSGFTKKFDTDSFAATQQISVETRLWLQDGILANTYVLDFNLVTVPEPTSAFFVAVLLATFALTRTRASTTRSS